MANCVIHSGTKSSATIYGKSYCVKCVAGINAARILVDKHVDPRDCFVWYVDAKMGWRPIPGTGCAHWVAHQKNWTGAGCLRGYPIRVGDVTRGAVVSTTQVQVGDLYVSPNSDHMGIVTSVTPAGADGGTPSIMITHDSSGQGQVSTNDFATYFHGSGAFYR